MPYIGAQPDKGNFADLNGAKLVIDADADTSLTADTDDQIDIEVAGADVLQIKSSSGDAVIKAATNAKDILFQQYDGRTLLDVNDGGWVARSNLENWNNALQDFGNSTVGAQDPSQYYGTINVTQLDRSDNPLRTASLYDAWPTNVAEIALAYDTVDVVEEFDVTFRFNYLQLDGSGSVLGSGGFGGSTAGR